MIRQLAIGLIPVWLMLATLVVVIGAILLRRFRDRKSNRQSPLTRSLLRSPGHSLRRKIEGFDFEIDALFVVTLMIPLIAFAGHISVSYFGGEPESISRILASSFVATLALAFAVKRLLPLLKKRREFVLGLEGELATGEELNQLMLDGCRVFHDVPTRYGNVDHVVVSESGVYCINTKMPGKPDEGAKFQVDYDRGMMRFPDREFRIPSDQVETEAKCLSDFLTSATGNQVEVEPLLAYPGWFIERIGRGRPVVFNPKNSQKFFVRSRSVLSPERVQQVAHQLEQLCRDVEPSFRESRSWEAAGKS